MNYIIFFCMIGWFFVAPIGLKFLNSPLIKPKVKNITYLCWYIGLLVITILQILYKYETFQNCNILLNRIHNLHTIEI